MKANVDPKIEIRTVADGEVHIVITLSLDDLALQAQAFLLMSDRKIKKDEARMVLRMRSIEGLDYMIEKLTAARKLLFGKD